MPECTSHAHHELIQVEYDAGFYSIGDAEVEAWAEVMVDDNEAVEDKGALRGWGSWVRAFRVVDADGDVRWYFGR